MRLEFGRRLGAAAAAAVLIGSALSPGGAQASAAVDRPQDPPRAPRFVQLAAGGVHTCGLTAAGSVYCWGDNGEGELGAGNGEVGDANAYHPTTSFVPAAVKGPGGSGVLSGISTIAARGVHTCALTVTGAVYCWGYNYYGDGGSSSSIPVAVTGLPAKAVAVTAGGRYACALLATGAVYCGGDNHDGELGDGTTRRSPVPVAVAGPGGTGRLSGVSALTAGDEHTCALTGTGTWCWGYNDDGQLGDGTKDSSHAPVAVER